MNSSISLKLLFVVCVKVGVRLLMLMNRKCCGKVKYFCISCVLDRLCSVMGSMVLLLVRLIWCMFLVLRKRCWVWVDFGLLGLVSMLM